VVDTGGFEPLVKDGILHEMARQTEQAIAEADAIFPGRRPYRPDAA
jgi:GTP-binding protein